MLPSRNLNCLFFDRDPLCIPILQQLLFLHIPASATAPIPLAPTNPGFDLSSARTVHCPPGHGGSALAAEDLPIKEMRLTTSVTNRTFKFFMLFQFLLYCVPHCEC